MAERVDKIWRYPVVNTPVAYTVPMVVEQTSRGERGYDIFFFAAQEPHRVPGDTD